jgi:hypothetical protein
MWEEVYNIYLDPTQKELAQTILSLYYNNNKIFFKPWLRTLHISHIEKETDSSSFIISKELTLVGVSAVSRSCRWHGCGRSCL